MLKVKLVGGALDGLYAWVATGVRSDQNSMLMATTPETIDCGTCLGTGTIYDGERMIYHKREDKGEVKYVWME